MNQFVIILIFLFIYDVNTNTSNNTFFPNLPVGPYRADIKGIYSKCNKDSKNNKIQFYYFMNKTSPTSAMIKGNFTNEIPIDDSLFLQYNFDFKDSIGRWQENAISYTQSKACTTTLTYTKKIYWKDFGFSGICPEPVGSHIVKGLDTSKVEKYYEHFNIPKTFLYGTFKFRFSITDKNKKIMGCFFFIVEIKRPWESYDNN